MLEQPSIAGLLLFYPKVYVDERGYFFESYNFNQMHDAGLKEHFVQDNESLSKKNVLRGLHFQNPPFAQGKLVRVISGSVLDVAVDIRKNSKTFKQHFSIALSAKNKTMLYIPPGFAHGFITLEDETIFQYKCTNFWNKESESGIFWDDKELGINWNCENPVLAEKDLALPLLKDSLNLFDNY